MTDCRDVDVGGHQMAGGWSRASSADVLRDRASESAGLCYTAASSLALHVGVAPVRWFGADIWPPSAVAPPRVIMTISLSGGGGPQSGGMTTIGGRPVQE